MPPRADVVMEGENGRTPRGNVGNMSCGHLREARGAMFLRATEQGVNAPTGDPGVHNGGERGK